ncbi:MAG: nucleoside triphosphate pyrophosphatase [Mycobacterium sp.]|jgi:septum formation protein|nr:nucleoside triphosphate pyrophosphatase [Mycobacterium sp.]MDT5199254.1 nucleoside triphosphate pyrophosphatase [Mycobacterium sp.]MDT5253146.1 nucleoside triphosphate pyrophosphatase [Mycobacterium sp.]MDT5275774.1 nucleoside triphosphate pyrophosphatase [Mycobacterium sp.]MDT7739622.1 nucleoside triphosphate pyrophosphatase [Mycobacterium sp.]
MTRLVLGSASAGRLRVLLQAGIEPLVAVSGVDEDAVVAALGSDTSPADVVRSLAQAKADQVATVLDPAVAADCVVIGCDSMLYIDGRLIGKPASADAARSQWRSMGGRSGQLYTGHCVLRLLDRETTHRVAESSLTTVYFAAPTDADLEAYLDSGEPLAVAGSFTLDGLGGWFVDRIDGDPSNVIGLSLPLTRVLLRRVGLSVAELWAANSVTS